ncbi:Tetrahydrofolate synthase [Rasamsonia emersonii CBS 393.64]|uniref:Folylpolyglutamate synthase n=1 Tax=Rasamsonia emersonii (strain ATCC 16479 / CBS 393.64 / IMI 116815) TaxID=1408163 RepID=A0A0F4YWI8_RASE3|nr:Tetrahydrofolate synthase [Rasamsonia emersonii CBS 393.64]KKA22609.1 Tetrahydrofolate synthase [Rasamsonia emersonii CBS 393.64]
MAQRTAELADDPHQDAIKALNSLQSNFAIVDAIRKSGRGMNQQAIPEMIEWCRRIGYEPSDLNRLNPIHIAGTKGKGSTSAFISSILTQYLPSASGAPSQGPAKINKVGLYTSPHLRFARERIQINNTPLSEEQFAKYFFETWDRLEESARAEGMDPTDPRAKPVYFRFLTLMAFHTYMSEGVDAAVIECGIGGEYDSTNIIVQPAVCGITSLGIDHVAVLGSTIEEIAWHKGGIIKPGAKAFTAPQAESALEVLFKRAKEKGTEIVVAEGHPELQKGGPVKLGLAGDFQYTNATVAAAVAGEFLRLKGVEGIPNDILKEPLPEKFRKGLEDARLGGRCETRRERNVSWYIDGGHTLESIRVAGEWFASQVITNTSPDAVPSRKPRVLIFNQQTRDSVALARALYQTLAAALETEKPFTHAIFCTNVTYKDTGYRPDLVSVNTNATDVEKLSVQKNLAQTWQEIDPSTEVLVLGTIEEAVEFVRSLADKESAPSQGENEVKALVTGSLHLVGGFLDVIETKPGRLPN